MCIELRYTCAALFKVAACSVTTLHMPYMHETFNSQHTSAMQDGDGAQQQCHEVF